MNVKIDLERLQNIRDLIEEPEEKHEIIFIDAYGAAFTDMLLFDYLMLLGEEYDILNRNELVHMNLGWAWGERDLTETKEAVEEALNNKKDQIH